MVSRTVTRTKHWLQAVRPLAQLNIAVPLVLGQAVAWHVHQRFDVGWLIAGFVWGVFDHAFIVLSNDYADRDADTGARTWISGGSGVLPEGKLSPSQVARAARLAAIGLVACSLGLAVMDRPWTPAYAAIAMALLWLYSFEPARMSYRGGGELLQGLGIGAGLPSLGYYLQSQAYLVPWWVLVPAIVLGVCANALSALPDVDDDRNAGKRTWPVRFGVQRSYRLAIGGIVLCALAVFGSTPGVSPGIRAIVAVTPLVPVALAIRASDIFAKAWWASAAVQLLLVLWTVALFVTP
ncbi:MAG: prenyltransferase [Myxococcota bacterium]